MIPSDTLRELLARAQDHAEQIGQIRLVVQEAADGSGRYLARIGWDEQDTISTPAPSGAPAWALARYPDWLYNGEEAS